MLTRAVSDDLESVASAQRGLLDRVAGSRQRRLASMRLSDGSLRSRSRHAPTSRASTTPPWMDTPCGPRTSRMRLQAPRFASRLVGESRAGAVPDAHVAGTAMRIMTGADARRRGHRGASGGRIARRRSGDDPCGDATRHERPPSRRRRAYRRHADPPGQQLTSIDIGVAAALGHDRVLVGARPHVALLATGTSSCRRNASRSRAARGLQLPHAHRGGSRSRR